MITPTLDFELDHLDQFLSDLEGLVGSVSAGVGVYGPAAAYALVWEWGNSRQRQAGPKTVLGTNPDGTFVWLSSQAPFGYIRKNIPQFWKALEEEMDATNWNSSNLKRELEKRVTNAASKVADLIALDAPIDSGELQGHIKVVKSGDPFLEETGNEFETLILE